MKCEENVIITCRIIVDVFCVSFLPELMWHHYTRAVKSPEINTILLLKRMFGMPVC